MGRKEGGCPREEVPQAETPDTSSQDLVAAAGMPGAGTEVAEEETDRRDEMIRLKADFFMSCRECGLSMMRLRPHPGLRRELMSERRPEHFRLSLATRSR